MALERGDQPLALVSRAIDLSADTEGLEGIFRLTLLQEHLLGVLDGRSGVQLFRHELTLQDHGPAVVQVHQPTDRPLRVIAQPSLSRAHALLAEIV